MTRKKDVILYEDYKAYFQKHLKKHRRKETLRNYNNALMQMEKYKRPYYLREITPSFLLGFRAHLQNKARKNNNKPNAVSRNHYINLILKMMRYAEEKKFLKKRDYTSIKGAKKTQRYQAVGNSWAVPVINWIGKRIVKENNKKSIFNYEDVEVRLLTKEVKDGFYVCMDKNIVNNINCSTIKEEPIFKNIKEIFEVSDDESIFISSVGCNGILRRKKERNLKINQKLEEYLIKISSTMDAQEIEKKSRIQKRGKLSEINLTEEQLIIDVKDNN